ncbi:MAG: DUF3808 domain-containing protein, partial [Elusimicrobia bacterium]|nr:DUF3808 domain-containing protein [Elusimicrobiota bacterium]MBD3412765.1 DUF3808 domain-containing protein [Elusimicrobiota bacterium]
IGMRMYHSGILKNRKLIVRELLILLGFFILGCTVYLFLPIRSLNDPLLDWEDPERLRQFWSVISRARYGSLNLAQGEPVPLTVHAFFVQLLFFVRLLLMHIGWVGLSLLTGGLIIAVTRITNLRNAVLLFSFIGAGPGIFLLANVTPGENTAFIMDRFMLLPLIPGLLLVGLLAERVIRCHTHAGTVLLIIIFFFGLPPGLHAFREHAAYQRNDFFVMDFGKNILINVPLNALFFSDRADELEFAMAYFLYARQYRTDIRFIDCNAGVTRSVYGPDYYHIWGKKRLAIRERVEKQMISETSRPVIYGTMDVKQVAIPRVSFGMLYVPARDRYPFIDWQRLMVRERGNPFASTRYKHIHQNKNRLLAQYCLDKGEKNKAEYFIESLKSHWDERIWSMLGAYWMYERHMLHDALARYRVLSEKYPDDTVIMLHEGVVLTQLGKYNEAQSVLEQAARLQPESLEIHYNLAVVYWHLNEWEKAADEFLKTIQINPEYRQARRFYKQALEKVRRE